MAKAPKPVAPTATRRVTKGKKPEATTSTTKPKAVTPAKAVSKAAAKTLTKPAGSTKVAAAAGRVSRKAAATPPAKPLSRGGAAARPARVPAVAKPAKTGTKTSSKVVAKSPVPASSSTIEKLERQNVRLRKSVRDLKSELKSVNADLAQKTLDFEAAQKSIETGKKKLEKAKAARKTDVGKATPAAATEDVPTRRKKGPRVGRVEVRATGSASDPTAEPVNTFEDRDRTDTPTDVPGNDM